MRKRNDDKRRRDFITRLKFSFERSGLSQRELADLTGQSGQAVSDWFNKSALPGGEALLRLPTALGVSGHWLITGEGPMVPTADASAERLMAIGGVAAISDVEEVVAEVRRKWQPNPAPEALGKAAAARIAETDELLARSGGRRKPGA